MAENEMYRNSNNNGNGTTNSGMPETPIAPEGGMPVFPGNGHVPTPPIAPEGGFPVFPGNGHIPTPPIAPEGGFPVFPGNGHVPTPPIAPEGGTPVYPGDGVTLPSFPIFPVYPSYPSTQYFGQVRFLNASTNSFPVNISIDNTTYAVNSRFGTVTNYDWVSDGFHTVTVRRATGLRTILFQQTFPFIADEKVTMVLVDTGSGGLEMVHISNTGCTNLPYNAGCYRFANMSYSGSSYDLMLTSGETVFRNINFQQVTPYKQAMASSYQFNLTNSSNFTVVREIPIIVIGTYPATALNGQPLVSFQADIAAGKQYTSFVIGNTWSDNSLRVLTLED